MINIFRKSYVVMMLIVLVGILSYANTFRVPFQFDDNSYIVNNPIIRTFHYFLAPSDVAKLTEYSPTAVPQTLRYAFMTRILGYFSLAINYHLHGLNVTGYHIVNLVIHIVNALFVYLIIVMTLRSGSFPIGAEDRGLYPKEFIAVAVALVFVSHPIQTQAVTYLSQRFTLLAACLYLLSLLFYITARTSPPGFKRSAFYVAALLSTVAAMMTKEFTFTLPFVITVYEMFFFKSSARDRLKVLAPFAVTLIIIPVLVFLKQGTVNDLDNTMRTITMANVTDISRIDHLLTQFRVIMLYLQLLFFPVNQNVDHDVSVYHSLFVPPVFASFIALAALFSLGVYLLLASRKQSENPEFRLASFGIIWFFLTLSVESSIIPMGELVAEYRLYLPSVGMILAIVSLLLYTARKYSRIRAFLPTLLSVTLTVTVITLATVTYLRNTIWASEITLWEDAARKSPLRVRPHQNLGIYYGMQGRLEDARRELIAALQLEPSSAELHNNLGMIYKKMAAYDDAIQEYTTVVKLAPGDGVVHYNLGNVYLAQDRVDEAIREYQVAAELIPDYDEVHNNLGIAYGKNGQFNEAISEFNRALQLNPQNANARNNMEVMMRKAMVSTRQ